ncbi:hypothetical protein AMTRI_Chr09g42800 [Amborella trichopoda]
MQEERGVERKMEGEHRHTVLAKFKENTDLSVILGELQELVSKLDFVKSYEWGTAQEGKRHQGFTHVFVITFFDANGLEEYVAHPAHRAYAIKFVEAVENLIILDYVPILAKSPA